MARTRRRPVALVGPTASGKSEAAMRIADRLGAEICSVDSMLVYRGMDVGTAKPTAEERARVPHHLVDLAEPSERFTVSRFQGLAHETLDDLAARDVQPLIVGGSGLYFRAVVDELVFPPEDPVARAALEGEARSVGVARLFARLHELDPIAAARIEPGNVRRTVRALEVAAATGRLFSSFSEAWERFSPGNVLAVGIRMPPEILAERIRARVDVMLAHGWLEEVRALVARGFGGWLTATQAIGYAELAAHLDGRLTLDDAVETTVKRTRNLARRQVAWFRRDPRITWLDAGKDGAAPLADTIAGVLGERASEAAR